MSGGFKGDLNWFRAFARSFNGCSMFSNWRGENYETVFIYVSLHGLGAVRETKFYSTTLPLYVLNENRIMVYHG